jgi:hypothetical protein
MPRFYFHLNDGTEHPDRLGSDLPGLEAVREYAAAYLGELLRESGGSVLNGDDWRLNVTDEAGLVLLTIHIFAIESASAQQCARTRCPTGSALAARSQR